MTTCVEFQIENDKEEKIKKGKNEEKEKMK